MARKWFHGYLRTLICVLRADLIDGGGFHGLMILSRLQNFAHTRDQPTFIRLPALKQLPRRSRLQSEKENGRDMKKLSQGDSLCFAYAAFAGKDLGYARVWNG